MAVSPKISVIIPTHNSEEYLGECLDSVLGQTLTDFEVVLVDDGSQDDTRALSQFYAHNDGRIRLFHQPFAGPGAARNLGLSLATGTFLLFLDSDDFFEADMFERLYQKAQETQADLLFYWYSKYDQATQSEVLIPLNPYVKQIPHGVPFCPQEYEEILFQLSGGQAWRYFFRTDFVRSFGFHFGKSLCGEDGVFTYPARAMARRMCFINTPFVHYRINTPHQLTRSCDFEKHLKRSFQETWKILKKLNRATALKQSFHLRKKNAQQWLKVQKKSLKQKI